MIHWIFVNSGLFTSILKLTQLYHAIVSAISKGLNLFIVHKILSVRSTATG